jgi:hypothetical protein
MYFSYFSVLSEIENIGQTKNIFGLTVKAFLMFRKWFTILKIVNNFSNLSSLKSVVGFYQKMQDSSDRPPEITRFL